MAAAACTLRTHGDLSGNRGEDELQRPEDMSADMCPRHPGGEEKNQGKADHQKPFVIPDNSRKHSVESAAELLGLVRPWAEAGPVLHPGPEGGKAGTALQ